MKLSLRTAIIVALLLSLLLPAIISGVISVHTEYTRAKMHMERDQLRYAETLAIGMQEPLWNLDPNAAKPLLDSLMSDPRIVRITVNDASLGVFISADHPERRSGHLHSLNLNVNKRGQNIGTVSLEMDDGYDLAAITGTLQRAFMGLATQLFLSLSLILFLLYTRILKPIQRLTEQSQKLVDHDLDTIINWNRQDEIGQLGQNLESSRQSIKTLMNSLEQKNLELEVDLMNRQHIEAGLIASQNRCRRLLESTHLIPWDANPNEWRFNYVGPQAEGLLGYPLAVWYSEGFLSTYLHPDDRHLAYHIFTSNEAIDEQFECRFINSEDREVWVQFMATSHEDDSKQRRLQGFIYDITERKEAELGMEKYRIHLEDTLELRSRALNATSHELESFSMSVSHDLRAPLRTIDGFSQVLLDDYADKLDTNARHYIQRIRSTTQAMSNLIDDLLNLAKLSRIELRRENINLADIARDIIEELSALYSGTLYSVEIDESLYANADPKLIRIALHNLLENAWKFSANQSAPQIRFSVSHVNQQQVYHISDNGIGFEMSDAETLFNPFQQLHAYNENGSNGIGLAIVQRIINRHEGHIWTKSSPNEGATFYFTLPEVKIFK